MAPQTWFHCVSRIVHVPATCLSTIFRKYLPCWNPSLKKSFPRKVDTKSSQKSRVFPFATDAAAQIAGPRNIDQKEKARLRRWDTEISDFVNTPLFGVLFMF